MRTTWFSFKFLHTPTDLLNLFAHSISMRNAWSNIEISPTDPEIIRIDILEDAVDTLPPHVQQIRQLITRFEVCHFKYQQHFENIKESILRLQATIDPERIGSNHIQHGEEAWKKDKTGRSQLGEKYLGAIRNWLGEKTQIKDPDSFNQELDQNIASWLGDKTPEKERLVRLLLARMIWDWESYERFLKKDQNKELEHQVCRIDICHYNFPENLDLLLKGIGVLKPIEEYEGCGSYSSDIKTFIEKEFSTLILSLNDLKKSKSTDDQSEKNKAIKVWLLACLAKTMKEQVGLTQKIDGLA